MRNNVRKIAPKCRLKVGDEVIVIAGKDKGKRGKLTQKIAVSKPSGIDLKVKVEGVNMVTKHVKPNPQANKPGGRQQIEAALHISNVAMFNPATGKADRVTYKTLDDGKKVRAFVSNGEVIDI